MTRVKGVHKEYNGYDSSIELVQPRLYSAFNNTSQYILFRHYSITEKRR